MPHPKQAANVYAENLNDELCVYDWEQKQMHALNPTAALVWEQCDGQTSPSQMAARLENELNVPNADKLVTLSLDRLQKAHLLESTVPFQAQRTITRREVLKMAGIGLALLPVVSSIALPSAAEAQSCVSNCDLGGPLGQTFNNCVDACEDVFQNAPPEILLCSVDQFTENNQVICRCNYYDPNGCNQNNAVSLGWN